MKIGRRPVFSRSTPRLIAGVLLLLLTNLMLSCVLLLIYGAAFILGWISDESLGGYFLALTVSPLYFVIAPIIVKKLGVDSLLAGKSIGDKTL